MAADSNEHEFYISSYLDFKVNGDILQRQSFINSLVEKV